MSTLGPTSSFDLDHAVEIADRIWWVGHHLSDDPFQCHAYLLEHGDQSVLFDPGGLLTLEPVWRKVCEVVDPAQIRWVVCHHQDPDIAGCLPELDRRITRPDAAIVTHWRAEALLKHYGVRLPFFLVDQNDWRLDLGGRVLQFVFTPYLHFPGAFTTFDEATGTLFSSDLFGGFTSGDGLLAEDVSYFEEIRPFHEHYMPSREILAHGLEHIERLPLKLIAPQHGRLIPEPLIAPIIESLKSLDCGLYLMVKEDTDIRRLSEMNQLLRQTMRQIAVARDFGEIAAALERSARVVFPFSALEFYALDPAGVMLHFAEPNRFHGVPADIPPQWTSLLDAPRPGDPDELRWLTSSIDGEALAIALFSVVSDEATGIAVMRLERPIVLHEAGLVALAQLSTPLEVALEREMLLRSVEVERERFFGLATHDTLTGMYNRLALRDPVDRILAMHDRGNVDTVVVTMLDIDLFKSINDRYGHQMGDRVLEKVGTAIRASVRADDVAARVGGEEFVVISVLGTDGNLDQVAERLRSAIGNLRFDEPDLRITVSAGVARRDAGETYEAVLARADAALYRAKQTGRDRSVVAEPRS
jgi:diguanylate cyclase (GGDEF)-like protein